MNAAPAVGRSWRMPRELSENSRQTLAFEFVEMPRRRERGSTTRRMTLRDVILEWLEQPL